jgi:uncharacterized protein (TIGR00730 family)
MKSIVVFCGSGGGKNSGYSELAYEVGKTLAGNGIRVIYGGAKIGLMGAVADGAISSGGDVIGVLPHFLGSKEIAHENLSELIMVGTMHERKLKMHELSDGVIALPGGFGTMEELFEMLTWAQLGLHQKPIGLLNFNGFYNPLITLADKMKEEGFLRPSYREMLLEASTLPHLLQKMMTYKAPDTMVLLSKQTT